MEISDFVQKKCNSGKNIQFKPKRFLKIGLGKISSSLEKMGAGIELESPSLLIIRVDGMQADINKSGRIIVKTENAEEAKKLFSKLVQSFK